jgi:hypothetical protein
MFGGAQNIPDRVFCHGITDVLKFSGVLILPDQALRAEPHCLCKTKHAVGYQSRLELAFCQCPDHSGAAALIELISITDHHAGSRQIVAHL